MFDLDKAIAVWRRTLEHDRAFDADDLDELERHVRDHVLVNARRGMPEQRAFEQALQDIGRHDEVQREYQKVFWGKRRLRRELLSELSRRTGLMAANLILALRSSRRQIGYTALNVVGLAVGIAGCLLLTCYVFDELRFDSFNEHADRIYRVTTTDVTGGGTPYAHTFPAAGPALAAELPEVQHATRLLGRGLGNHDVLRLEEREITDAAFLYVDSSFFDVFTVDFVEGSPSEALRRPNEAVLSRPAARRLVGEDSPVGRILELPNMDPTRPARTFEVVGVVEDFPPHAHVHFDVLFSLSTWDQGRTAGYFDNNWRVLNSYTYVRLQGDEAAASLRAKLPEFVQSRMGRAIPEGFRVVLDLQPLTSIHLNSHLRDEFEPNADKRTVYLMGIIAVFLVLISGINFVNLVTAKGSLRAAEIGVRKTIGARRIELIRQFLTESVLLTLTATAIALLLFALALPAFNVLAGKQLTTSVLVAHWIPPVALMAVVLAIGIGAGSYPAFVLSAFHPGTVLRPGPRAIAGRATIRKALVVAQFAVSIGLLIATAVIYRQLSYMQDARLGFDMEHLMVLDYRFREGDESRVAALRQELLRHTDVEHVTFGTTWPTRPEYFTLRTRPEGTPDETAITSTWYNVDANYVSTLGLELLDGRDFAQADSGVLIINEAAAREFGWQDPLGKQLFLADDGVPLGRVVGVVRDFHYRSLIDPVEPVVLSTAWYRARQPIVRLSGSDPASVMAHLESVGARLFPDESFGYQYVDQAYGALYESERKLSRTIGVFAGLALLTACLGLFGLAAYTTAQRRKEIGVRKVLGASAASIAGLLTKQFVGLVAVAFVISAPLSYLAMQQWLDGFAHRVELQPGLFLLAGALTLAIAVLTVGSQSIRVASADPVTSLRSE